MENRILIHRELKKLDIRIRNKVRAIVAGEIADSVRILNSLRERLSVHELAQIDVVLRAFGQISIVSIPDLFPSHPQITENFKRLKLLTLPKQLAFLDVLCKSHFDKLEASLRCVEAINVAVLKKDYQGASLAIAKAYREAGASHFLLRKAALISVERENGDELPEVDSILEDAGIRVNNLVSSSLVNCYQEGQDFLSMKKSLLGLPNKGDLNKFTRDTLRLAFHPHAADTEDLTNLIQSSLQSSLLDAIIIAKVNKHAFQANTYNYLNIIFERLENLSDISAIANQYTEFEDGEELFYKRSSAWLENDSVVLYRTLQDNFYDFPESPYIKLDEELLTRVGQWVGDVILPELPSGRKMTRHTWTSLSRLERDGSTTRSSVFNYLIAKHKGYADISEDGLLLLMSRTRDLSKTINPAYLRNMAACSSSQISKLIYFLLIAKKSRSEGDDHQLRRILQKLVLDSYNGRLVDFVAAMSTCSQVVAEYMYEVFTEDFIAKLSKIILTASQITETRAALHRFMGDTTGEKIYLDRARTLLIDHQINKLRNEIDDNRIYVDSSRLLEWINDELMRELNAILTALDLNNSLEQDSNPQMLEIIGRCYAAFCGSTVFGIASYLGRRIRHGTFKGHLYSSVVNLSKLSKYQSLLNENLVGQIWSDWQARYETVINEIIIDRLHVESPGKRQALLRPRLEGPHKMEIANACSKAVMRDYSERKTSQAAPQILIEYCWRMLEDDLNNVNTFLKGKKSELIGADLLSQIKSCAHRSELAGVFCRDLTHHINEKLSSMYGWFKRPISVSPKASLSLLFRAVAAEVRDTFPDFKIDQLHDHDDDIEIVGGAYHVLYDAFYVVIYNAAKHGKPGAEVDRLFRFVRRQPQNDLAVSITITSQISDDDTSEYVNSRLEVNPDDNLDNAQISEDRSGIRKLHQLARSDPNFSINILHCEERNVVISMSYLLEH